MFFRPLNLCFASVFKFRPFTLLKFIVKTMNGFHPSESPILLNEISSSKMTSKNNNTVYRCRTLIFSKAKRNTNKCFDDAFNRSRENR